MPPGGEIMVAANSYRAMNTVIVQERRVGDENAKIPRQQHASITLHVNDVARLKVIAESVYFEQFRISGILQNQNPGVRVACENRGVEVQIGDERILMRERRRDLRKVRNCDV